ncbi:MAG TPA: FYDLN acid domain-containing protein [Deltaproteobacteria bacterium]|nr:FYDLN acid domain-containing protein [Deltaproteobacteria bacterium]HQI01968.1 FYDLN acid domain-containing protein [Deltaproteobacteria bacterium]
MVERGTRYKCYKCETGFYDLCRPQPICPSCGEDQNNREVVHAFKRKKRRSYSKAEPEVHALPEEGEEMHDERERLSESEEDRDEYILEKEDIALEEGTEDDSK